MNALQVIVQSRSVPVPESGCWLWTGWIDKDGYGGISLHGFRRAHRLSYAAFVKAVPADAVICHKCDTRSCVNPSHLFVGTRADNSEDARRKGRHPKGEARHTAKLTNDQVAAIRRAKGPLRLIAGSFGISRSQASRIRRGDAWGHV